MIYSAGSSGWFTLDTRQSYDSLPEGNPPGSSPLLAGGFSSQRDNVTFRCDATSDSWPGYSHPGTIQFSNRIVGILHDCLKGRTLYSEQTAWGHHHKTKSCLTSDARWACNG